MRDVDDRHAARLQLADQFEESLNVISTQTARGLIEHDHPGAGTDSAGNLHQLLLRNRERIHRSRRIDRCTDRLQHLTGSAVHHVTLNETESTRKLTETQVLTHAEILAERELLMHHRHSRRQRITRTVESNRTPSEENLTLVRLLKSRENLSQCTLAGAVLTADRVAGPRAHVEAHVR